MQTSMTHLMDDVTDPSDWKSDFTVLKDLDASLRCDLCFDIYTSPVSIKSCHHTFCSTCIRTHINQSGNSGSFCPKCRQTKAYDSELIPQPVLEITALEWKKSRSFLARLQTQHQHPPPPQHAESSRSGAASSSKRLQSDNDNDAASDSSLAHANGPSPRRSKRIKTDLRSAMAEATTGSRSSPLTIDDDDDEDDLIHGTDDEQDGQLSADDRDGEYIEGAASARSSPSKRRTNGARDDSSSMRDTDRELKADDLVECPICSHRFTVTALNRHLDLAVCYNGFPEPSAEDRGLVSKPAKSASSWFTKNAAASSSSSVNPDASVSMANEKRLVRPQYNLKNERDLRKLLDEAGLPTSGDREKLVERHRQWINIWNANLDSIKARRSAAQLRKDLAAWERTKTSAKDHSAHVDRQKTTWIKTNKSQFDDLIQKAKMGAIKDKKLRDASAAQSISDQQQASTASDDEEDRNCESQPHVITSSLALPDAGSTLRATVDTLGSDS